MPGAFSMKKLILYVIYFFTSYTDNFVLHLLPYNMYYGYLSSMFYDAY